MSQLRRKTSQPWCASWTNAIKMERARVELKPKELEPRWSLTQLNSPSLLRALLLHWALTCFLASPLSLHTQGSVKHVIYWVRAWLLCSVFWAPNLSPSLVSFHLQNAIIRTKTSKWRWWFPGAAGAFSASFEPLQFHRSPEAGGDQKLGRDQERHKKIGSETNGVLRRSRPLAESSSIEKKNWSLSFFFSHRGKNYRLFSEQQQQHPADTERRRFSVQVLNIWNRFPVFDPCSINSGTWPKPISFRNPPSSSSAAKGVGYNSLRGFSCLSNDMVGD